MTVFKSHINQWFEETRSRGYEAWICVLGIRVLYKYNVLSVIYRKSILN